jgi:hypothetical protein
MPLTFLTRLIRNVDAEYQIYQYCNRNSTNEYNQLYVRASLSFDAAAITKVRLNKTNKLATCKPWRVSY